MGRTLGKGEKTTKRKAGKEKKTSAKQSQKTRLSVPFWRKMGVRLVLSFLVPVIFIIILGVVSYQKASEQIVASYEQSVEQTVDMMNQYLTLSFDTVQSNYKEYLNNEDLNKFYKGLFESDTSRQAYLPREYLDIFRQAVSTDALISNIHFLSDSQPSITTARSEEANLYSAYMATVQGEMVKADTYSYLLFGNNSDVDEKLLVEPDSYAVRLARHFTNIKTVMLVDIKRSGVEEALASLDAGEGSSVGLVTCDGSEYLSELSAGTEGNTFVGKAFVEEAMASEEMNGSSYVTDNDKEYMFVYSKLDGRNAMICVLIPTDNIIGQTADIQRMTILLVILASLVAIVMGSLLAKHFGAAITEIVHKVKKVSGGDLTVEVHTKRKDEFRLLADGVTDMIVNMRKLVTGIKDVNAELGIASDGMSAASDNFMTTSKHIIDEISEINVGVEKLDSESDECQRKMEVLSDKILEVTDNSTQISGLAKEAESVIQIGMKTVDNLEVSTDSTIGITQNIIKTIDKLVEKSKSIETIIEAINEIAEQTNLLSLNASIEAARAGEAGRGFAVVAQEIGKLAEESIHSSDKIAKIIKEIEDNTKEAIEVAKQAENIVDEQKKAVNGATESFEQIGNQVSELLLALNQINISVESMEEDRNIAIASIAEITAISAETAAGSANVSDAAKVQMSSIKELDKASETLKNRADELNLILEGFQV